MLTSLCRLTHLWLGGGIVGPKTVPLRKGVYLVSVCLDYYAIVTVLYSHAD